MASGKFNVAFSTIGTNTFVRFVLLLIRYPVSWQYLWRAIVSGIVSLVAEPFRWYQNVMYARRLKKMELPESPVFILGHWRSGTTLLHNLMCRDEQYSFVTTYQSVFANVFFSGRWLFRPLMKALMPARRATDNVRLSAELPQEEGFALANMGSFALYNYWYFPHCWNEFFNRYVACEGVSDGELKFYRKQYRKLIAQSILFHGKAGFISKNPPNTGRVNQILEMFPQAKFIYLYRNPLMVFQSTVDFFWSTMPALRMQHQTQAELQEMVFGMYEKLITRYEEQKHLIPKENLVEIRYESFVEDPLNHIKRIYHALQLPGLDNALPAFTEYLEAQKKFAASNRTFSPEEKERIASRLGFAMERYGYQ